MEDFVLSAIYHEYIFSVIMNKFGIMPSLQTHRRPMIMISSEVFSLSRSNQLIVLLAFDTKFQFTDQIK